MMTPELVGNIVRGLLSLLVVGAWIYLAVTGQDVSGLNIVVMAVLAFWFGGSLLTQWQTVKAAKE